MQDDLEGSGPTDAVSGADAASGVVSDAVAEEGGFASPRIEGLAALELTPREFNLLLELAREPGAVVPKGFLAQRLEPLGEAIDFNALEVHVFNLRRKLGPERIHTVRGVGYLLRA